jgi:hypothetical protein
MAAGALGISRNGVLEPIGSDASSGSSTVAAVRMFYPI